jgi:4'-phosphopantetheinyl transferase
VPPGELSFEIAEFGKPALLTTTQGQRLEFSLSHSGSVTLLAITRDRPVGVDVEQWNADVEHARVAERFFSHAERQALASLHPDSVVEGFYSAWSRKEAYLKATGDGVSRGLDHFDVSLVPGEPARLIADRKDPGAPSAWTMGALDVADGYSAALVVAAPIVEVTLFDASTFTSHHAPHASTNPANTSAM